MLDGNAAATEALKLARVKVISAYPITPQSPIAERLSELVAAGELNARYIRVESEHTAMSCAIGAQFTGVRAATATSSVGLALMHEVLGVASGCRSDPAERADYRGFGPARVVDKSRQASLKKTGFRLAAPGYIP